MSCGCGSCKHQFKFLSVASTFCKLIMDQQQRVDLYEPSPRLSHIATSVSDVSTSQLVVVWGGETAEFYSRDGGTQLASRCQLFHLQSEVWSERHAVLGPPHLDCLVLPARRLKIICSCMVDSIMVIQDLILSVEN